MPQASSTLLPNQNGHHASPATNAHRSMRSTMSAGILVALETPSASLCSEKTGPDVRDGTSALIRRFPGIVSEISGEKPARYHTSGESLFSPVKTNPFPRASGGASAHRSL